MNWKQLFDSIHTGELIGATDKELFEFQENCSIALNRSIQVEFPQSYLEFLSCCSTGITILNGTRELQFFSTQDLVQSNKDYQINKYLMGAISIAMDGSGNHIFFDCNKKDDKLYGIHSSDLDWDEVKLLADNFEQLCRETMPIEEIMRN